MAYPSHSSSSHHQSSLPRLLQVTAGGNIRGGTRARGYLIWIDRPRGEKFHPKSSTKWRQIFRRNSTLQEAFLTCLDSIDCNNDKSGLFVTVVNSNLYFYLL